MIKFFRKIRYNLISENRMGKYFKYAIGEILLVVIGILIALQINNWNEERKNKVIETQLLENLRNSLVSDVQNQINPILEQIELDLSNIKDIKHFLKVSESYHDSMNIKFNSLMYSKIFLFEVTSYKALENEGLKLIQNPELKSEILKLYNMEYTELEYNIENFMNNMMSFYRPNMRELFLFLDDNEDKGYKPENYESLRTNREFRNNLITCTTNFSNIYKTTTRLKFKVESLIASINKELK